MGFEIFGVIFFVVIYFAVVAFFGFLELLKTYWFVPILVATPYFIFHKFINRFFRRLWKKRIYSIFMILIAIFIVVVLFIRSIGAAMHRKSERIYSPDKAYVAQVDETNCGAMCRYSTEVTISNAHSFLSNFDLISYRIGNKTSIFWFDGSVTSAVPSWVDNNTLKITYGDCTQLYSGKIKQWKNIKVIYEGSCSEE